MIAKNYKKIFLTSWT